MKIALVCMKWRRLFCTQSMSIASMAGTIERERERERREGKREEEGVCRFRVLFVSVQIKSGAYVSLSHFKRGHVTGEWSIWNDPLSHDRYGKCEIKNLLSIINYLYYIYLYSKRALGSICKKKTKWNQIKKNNNNGNYYFVNLFGLNRKQNHTIYDSFSFCLFYLYNKKVINY